jgi:hypothetical protein
MPVHVVKRGDKYRIVEKSGRIATNAAGTAIDGGGHNSKEAAQRQATAVNISLKKKKK